MLMPLGQAIEYIQAGDKEKGKELLVQILEENPRDENAWLWLALCLTDVKQERECYERILKINPHNQYAIEGLQRLKDTLSRPTQPKVSRPIDQQQPVQKPGLAQTLITLAIFAVGAFLVLLFLYAWWLVR